MTGLLNHTCITMLAILLVSVTRATLNDRHLGLKLIRLAWPNLSIFIREKHMV